MASARIVEAIDILEDCAFCLASGFPAIAPDQLCFDGFEKGLNHRIVITITFAAHRYLKGVLGQASLILVGTVLRAAIRMMNTALGWLPQRYRHIQRADRQIPLHTITHGPADDPARIKIDDHSQIEPNLIGPDIGYIASPFLIWAIR